MWDKLALIGAAALGAAQALEPGEVVRLSGSPPLAGPVLTGDTVLWGSQVGLPRIFVADDHRPVRLWRAQPIDIPAGADDPGYVTSVAQRVEALEASASAVAFIHSATLNQTPRCRFVVPRCGQPSRSIPLLAEVVAGQRRGPFRSLSGALRPCLGRQWLARDVATAGTRVAYVQELRACPRRPYASRVALTELGGRTIVIRSSALFGFKNVALAGHFLAWEQELVASAGPAADPAVVVYDLRMRREVYRVTTRSTPGPRAPAAFPAPAFDLQDDGTLALLAQREVASSTCGTFAALGLSFASPTHPRPRPLPLRDLYEGPSHAEIARDRIVYERAPCNARPHQLVMTTLSGRTRVIAGPGSQRRAPSESFDFDGRRVTYSAVVPPAGPPDDPTLRTSIYAYRTP